MFDTGISICGQFPIWRDAHDALAARIGAPIGRFQNSHVPANTICGQCA
jgi:hypothetical protein